MFSHARRLRWSSEFSGYDTRIEGLADRSVDLGVPGGSALLDLVDAFVAGDETRQRDASRAVEAELGAEAFVDAAAVFGNFEMMNRVAEGAGIPIPPQAIERESDLIDSLGIRQSLKSQHL